MCDLSQPLSHIKRGHWPASSVSCDLFGYNVLYSDESLTSYGGVTSSKSVATRRFSQEDWFRQQRKIYFMTIGTGGMEDTQDGGSQAFGVGDCGLKTN